MISIERLTKSFGTNLAVDSLSLSVEKGEIFGFLGPNGAGKTTTIRMLNGLIRPTAGRVLIKGHDMQTDPLPAKRIMGYIPDRPFIYEKLTGMEYLTFVGGLYSVPRETCEREGRVLMEFFEILHAAHELVESYSHGMKQKLVLSATLLHKPEVLVIDEPMVGLDPRSAKLLKALLTELCHGQGVTLFLSTHTLEVAEAVCDRIGIIQKGQLRALGTREELARQAASPGSPIEDVFLRLTEEETALAESLASLAPRFRELKRGSLASEE